MNDRQQRLLVVDDDSRLRDLLVRYLGEQGFEVKAVGDAPQMDKLRTREHFDLIVLDLMLPGEDGLTICRRLRGTGDTTPIIMLTAKGEEVDRIVGLEMGADDYLPKPFNPRELLARIQAVLRRRPPAIPGAPTSGERTTVSFGDVCVDLAFLGTNGFSVVRGMTTPDQSEAMAKRAMCRAARRTIVVTDSTKAGVDHFHRFARPEEVDLLVTDTQLDDETAEQLDAAGTDVVRT